MLDRSEAHLQAEPRKAIEELLSKGIPIYYSEPDDESGRIIKLHPDGRQEYVTFDFATEREVILGAVADGGKE